MREWVWGIGGIKVTGENRSSGTKTCLSATLSTWNPTWTGLGSKPALRGEKPATDRRRNGASQPTVRYWMDRAGGLAVLESGEERYILSTPGIDCRIVQSKARSLYRLSYPCCSLYTNQNHSPPSVRHVAFIRSTSRGEPLTYNERHIPQDPNRHFSNESWTAALTYHAATKTAPISCAARTTAGHCDTNSSTSLLHWAAATRYCDFSTETRVSTLTRASTSVTSMLRPSIIVLLDLLRFLFACVHKTGNGTLRDVKHRPDKGVPGTRVPKCNLTL